MRGAGSARVGLTVDRDWDCMQDVIRCIMPGPLHLLQTENTGMANTAQARKRARQSEIRRKHNSSLRSALRTAMKKVRKAIEAGDKTAATTVLHTSQSVIDRITDKRIMHKNAASRHKSRLAQAVRAMA